MLNVATVDTLSLHTGNPGADGTANEYDGDGYSRQSCEFNSPADGERTLKDCVIFDGEEDDSVTWVGTWAGSTFRGAFTASGTFDECGKLMLVKDDTAYGIADDT
jgi:hypothetical protein